MSTLQRLSVLTTVLLMTCTSLFAQTGAEEIKKALTTIDPEIVRYFPRWRICEPDLQIQIRQTFALMGRRAENLDASNIVVTSAPVRVDEAEPSYELILVECGSERMVASEIAAFMRKLSYRISDPKRPYCYQEIPPDQPPSAPQIAQIIDYMGRPTNVNHSFSLSAFEQTLKLGNTGFWISSSLGTDAVGYHYWSSGEGRITLQRPLYENTDAEWRGPIPYLINAEVGFGYRLNGALDGTNRLLDFIPGRKLNAAYGGKLVANLDFYMPFHAPAGISVNMELPLRSITRDQSIDPSTYYSYDIGNRAIIAPSYPVDPLAIAPILRSTGQITLFYNWWVDRAKPENFFRFDVGINYAEVREAALFRDSSETGVVSYIATEGVSGLRTYKPNEALDWVYAKVEYRNQNTFPFGMSVQYSNQVVLGRIYVPVAGDWLYVEARYSNPVRGARPFEMKNFFMISPVLRLNF